MSDDSVGCGVILLVMVVVFAVGGLLGEGTGMKRGRCQERWAHQHTLYDTLQTIRSGCDLPQVRR